MPVPNSEEIFTTWTRDVASGDVSVVCLVGELDASTAPGFLTDVQEVLDRKHNIVLDVHLLSYVDSTGVAAILSIQHALAEAGKRMGMVGCHGLFTKILRITHIESELSCYEDIDAAISAVSKL